MKRVIAVLLALCLYAAVCCFPATAANRVPEMEIDVALRPDGSAVITQTWAADTEEGTEFYLACRDSGYLEITDFSVSDGNGAYTLLENWDVDASFEEKAGKCGILETGEGVELCWGIGEYGSRQYTITYVLHNLVGAYFDADGFNHRFVDETSLFPTDVTLTIRSQDGTPLTSEICDIWAFGFDGQIQFEDGAIRAWSESALESGEHMTIMVSLKKGVLSPVRNADGSFGEVKERAFGGSDYTEEDVEATPGEILLGTVILLFAGVLVVLAVLIPVKLQKARQRKQLERVDYFRDAPNNGNLNVTHRLGVCCNLCQEDALLGAYLLRLISAGCLEPEEDGNSEQVNLRLVHPPQDAGQYDDILYTVLEAAAGQDGVLQAKELERYYNHNSKPLASFIASCQREADRALLRGGCFKGVVRGGVKNLTKQGQIQLDEILGLKRFLLDFSLIHERGVQETVIWQDYLIYAVLLGIADKVAPQIRELYPEALPQVERFTRCISYAGYYNHMMYGIYAREHQLRETARRSGSGGRSSFGGGSGFSSGGGAGVR